MPCAFEHSRLPIAPPISVTAIDIILLFVKLPHVSQPLVILRIFTGLVWLIFLRIRNDEYHLLMISHNHEQHKKTKTLFLFQVWDF